MHNLLLWKMGDIQLGKIDRLGDGGQKGFRLDVEDQILEKSRNTQNST